MERIDSRLFRDYCGLRESVNSHWKQRGDDELVLSEWGVVIPILDTLYGSNQQYMLSKWKWPVPVSRIRMWFFLQRPASRGQLACSFHALGMFFWMTSLMSKQADKMRRECDLGTTKCCDMWDRIFGRHRFS